VGGVVVEMHTYHTAQEVEDRIIQQTTSNNVVADMVIEVAIEETAADLVAAVVAVARLQLKYIGTYPCCPRVLPISDPSADKTVLYLSLTQMLRALKMSWKLLQSFL